MRSPTNVQLYSISSVHMVLCIHSRLNMWLDILEARKLSVKNGLGRSNTAVGQGDEIDTWTLLALICLIPA